MYSEYSEIPGVYTPSPRPFASIRRSFRTYRWFFIATSVVLLIIIISTLFSYMIGAAVDDDETSEREKDQTNAEISQDQHRNHTLKGLLSLSWPRRDETWYKRRWEGTHMRCPFSSEGMNDTCTKQVKSRPKRSLEIRTLKRDSSTRTDHYNISEEGASENSSFDDEDKWQDFDLNENDGSTFAYNDTFNWNRNASVLPQCSHKDLREALKRGSEEEKKLDEMERDLESMEVSLERNSPAFYHQKAFRKTSPKALAMSRQGYRMDHASRHVTHMLKLNKEDATFDTRWLGDLKGTPYCGQMSPLESFCSKNEKYRSIDGSCNNLKHPQWGMAFTPYRRAMPPDYADGIMQPREGKNGESLPGARLLSRKVHSYRRINSQSYTLLTMAWGQFVDHDLTGTAQAKGKNGSGISCCHEKLLNNATLKHPECFEILISENDTFYRSKNITCMEFSRSAPAPRCTFGPREQLNQNTHFLDGSVIYGSTDEDANNLRTHSEGLLKTQVTDDGRQLLSPSLDSNDSCNTEYQMHYNQHCFVSGDSRVNENILLTILHTVFTRHHNMIAQELRDINPDWDDQRLYQETRRIIIAQIQHITYHEFLPSILGPHISYGLKLSPKLSGDHWGGYNVNIHPGLANGFAGGAFRFGHSMIQGLIQSIEPSGKSVQFEQLRKFFFSPFALYDPDTIGNLVRGQVSQMSAAVDAYFTTQVTNRLFQTSGNGHGLDLVSINIQRGRDHGLPSYTRWRMMCGLERVNKFSDLTLDLHKDSLKAIQEVYNDVDDIDLYTGGMAEKPIKDGLVGPTFACIIADQFIRLKSGDRFWYENSSGPNPFTEDQLRELHKTTLSRILCDNIPDLGSVQKWPLRKFEANNPRHSCSSNAIPRVSFGEWEEGDI